MRRRSGVLIVLALAMFALSACAAERAFRRGEDAARLGDWDAAVVHYRRAVQENPDKAEFKIKLERAMQNASRDHLARARELEESDQLDAALREYRRALEFDTSNRLAASKTAELERVIRDRVEAARPKPRIEQLREEARQAAAPPMLNPADRSPLTFTFTSASIKDVVNTITSAAGINTMWDSQAEQQSGRGTTINLDGVTLEEGLNQILAANQLYYKVLNPRTIMIIPDTAQKHAQYDELAIRTFYLSHSDSAEVMQVLNQIVRLAQTGTQPMIMQNKTANTITVRATVPMLEVIERVIRANDKPRAEVVVDVEILEVNRRRMKEYGVDLSSYNIGLFFSPESPPSTGESGTTTAPFNLNTISQGVSTADFYLSVPSAVIRFMESDGDTRILAKPQLRGAEGTKLTLNLGEEVPVVSTIFGAAAPGGFASIPQSSFNYRNVGVNVEMTPRVTYDGEIILELAVENSSLGGNITIAGQSIPRFNSRKVTTKLRLREGESNLLAGLISENETRTISGVPGLIRVPGLRDIFANNTRSRDETDIVMLLTPHIVRTHELTAEDLAPIYIGTQQRVGLTGAPQLIAPPESVSEPPAGAGEAGVGRSQPGAVPGVPLGPQAGAAAPGVPQPVRPTTPPGTSAVPGQLPPPQPAQPAAPGATTTPPPVAPLPEPAEPTPTPEPTEPATPPATPAQAAAQLIVTPPGTEFRVGGGPYTVPVSINGVSRLSTVTLTLTFDPTVLRARSVQEGSFMRQGSATPAFTPRIDAGAGRVDVAITRTNDATGASGSGLLAAVLFDAIAQGNVTFSVSGTGTTPEGTVIPITTAPVTVTVR